MQYPGQTETEPFVRAFVLLDGTDVIIPYSAVIELPADALGNLSNYVGGLAISDDLETIAASSPVGGTILTLDVWHTTEGGLIASAWQCWQLVPLAPASDDLPVSPREGLFAETVREALEGLAQLQAAAAKASRT